MHNEQDQKRVLICDDDKVSRKIISSYIKNLGYEIVGEASTGIEAMYQFIERNPHIILLDINMPMGSGLTVLSFIRDISSSAIVVMITGDQLYYTPETVIKTLEMGANDYLIKGKFNEQRLLKAITKEKDSNGNVKTVSKQDFKDMFDLDEPEQKAS
jgi:two-component system chemotaxis response regulator CheY